MINQVQVLERLTLVAPFIEGVSMTTTGFIGPARYGPIDLEPDIVTGLGEFERVHGDRQQLKFGTATLHNYLWHAVHSFFEEGGKRLYAVHRPPRAEHPRRDNWQSDLEAVLRRVAQAYGQRVEDLVKPTCRPSEARQVGIYAARRVAGADLKTVARRFGLGYTAVSRRVGTVANRLRNDPRLRSQVEKIDKDKVKT